MGSTVLDQQLGCLWQKDHLLSISLSGYINYLDRNNPSKPLRVIKVSLATLGLEIQKRGPKRGARSALRCAQQGMEGEEGSCAHSLVARRPGPGSSRGLKTDSATLGLHVGCLETPPWRFRPGCAGEQSEPPVCRPVLSAQLCAPALANTSAAFAEPGQHSLGRSARTVVSSNCCQLVRLKEKLPGHTCVGHTRRLGLNSGCRAAKP